MIFPLKMIGTSLSAYTVRFILRDSTYLTVTASDGAEVLKPTDPTVDGYNFLGWYTGENGTGSAVTFPFTPDKNMIVYAYIVKAVVIGFTGLSDSSGNLVWTDDIADESGYTTSTDGNYVSVSSPLDNVFPYSDMTGATDAAGNQFVKIPRLYIKWVKKNGILDGIKISNAPYDSSYFCPDIFQKSSTEYYDYCLIGIYEGSTSNGKLASQSGKICSAFMNLSAARTAATSVGSGYGLYNFGMMVLYNFLCMLYYKTANIQTVFAGRTSADSASDTGTCDPIYRNGWNTSTGCVKMLGVENPYGNIEKWIDGIVFSGTSIYAGANSISGKNLGFTRPSTDGYASRLECGTNDNVRSYVYCRTASGTADTYTGDKVYYSSTGVNLANGGHYYMGDSAGLWCLAGTETAQGTSPASVGARLAKME